MTTHDYFEAVFGSRWGRPYTEPVPSAARADEWLQRLFRHFAVAPDNYIRTLTKLSQTVYADDFCFGVSTDAVGVAWERFPREAQAMVEELHRTVFSRLTEVSINGDCTGVVLDLAFCMVARDGLSSDEIEIVRDFLRNTDASIDQGLGQRPLCEW